MLDTITGDASAISPATGDWLERIRTIGEQQLAPMVRRIDAEGVYPEAVMRALGGAGAFAAHLPKLAPEGGDLAAAIRAMAAIGEHCLSTAFCMWCQNALAWYIDCSENASLRQSLGAAVARGAALGGTGLSNPMKTLFGIETIRLTGRRVAGGYRVSGLLPWVSNLGAGHYFAGIFEDAERPKRYVMAAIPCDSEGLRLADGARFLALDGSATYALRLREVFVPEAMLLADPIDAYLPRIRAGFVLLQTGMAFGLIEGCIRLMRQAGVSLGHVNRYLPQQPDAIAEDLAALIARVERLAATPFETGPAYWRAVLTARLRVGEAAVEAAHAAMLHCGARGYVTTGTAQRRLREAYFVAILTPATKQLRKMLAEMPH